MKYLLLTLLLPFCLAADVMRVFEYVADSSDQANRIVLMLQGPGIIVKNDPVLGLVTVIADTEEKLSKTEEAFRKYYKPKPNSSSNQNIELVLSILHATVSGNQVDVPAALVPVVQQLKSVTNLKSFQSVEMQMLRARVNTNVESSGMLTWTETPENFAPQYQFKATVGTAGNLIRLEHLHFGVRVPVKTGSSDPNNTQFQMREVGINASFDVKPGQQVVVGKTNTSGKDGALILVVSAKIVD